MTQSSIIVFGEALVDLFKDGLVVGGAPFNVARHLAGLGFNPLFISAIGQDNAADLILQEIERYKLMPQGVQVLLNQRTGVVHVHENAQGHQFEIMSNCAYDFIESSNALACIATLSDNNSKILYHGTLGLRNNCSLETFQMITEALQKDKDSMLYLDINWRAGHVTHTVAMACLHQASIIKVSIEELQMVLSWFDISSLSENKVPKKECVEQPIKQLMSVVKAQLLLVTYGELGSAAFSKDGVCLASAPAIKNQAIVDTVGAGDAFSGFMLLALTKKWPLDIALQRANAFAADVCGIRGAVPSDLGFYKKHFTA